MRKIGQFLKENRIREKKTLSLMEKETKIKKEFIESIEEGRWNNLPEYPVLLGFVKSISKNLNLSEDTATALLRRDYPFSEKKININPKPDLNIRRNISPKIITLTMALLLAVGILGYLVYQYYLYVLPPKLVVFQPESDQTILTSSLTVSGKASLDATVTANNQRIVVDDSGEFADMITIDNNTKNIVFIARSRYGKETVVIRKIEPNIE